VTKYYLDQSLTPISAILRRCFKIAIGQNTLEHLSSCILLFTQRHMKYLLKYLIQDRRISVIVR